MSTNRPFSTRTKRFVTEEAVSLMFDIKLEDMYVVQCWRYVVYVHGKGKLVELIKFAFPESTLQELQESYRWLVVSC